MLDIKFVRQNLHEVLTALTNRGNPMALDEFSRLEADRRGLLIEVEELRHRRNSVSDEIARLKKAKQSAEDMLSEMKGVSTRIKDLEKKLNEIEPELERLAMLFPNLPHESVPIGKNAEDNIVVRTVGTVPVFHFEPKAHWDLGADLGILDLERAARIAGSRFPLYFGPGARLERALINFMLEIHTREHGYTEVLPPFLVNRDSMTHTGQLPKFEDELFRIDKWDFFLIPTAEVPVTNIHTNEILDEEILPLNYTAYTPCFRAEAGSHGKDVRGLIRQHQFNKVELVKFVRPEESYRELEILLSNAEEILKRLGLAYQVICLCTGDLGFSASKTYDIEVWMPHQGKYREISSCSNFENFQARRGNIRYRRKGIKGTELVHTLNGSGLAVGRTFAAILENYQQADGSVVIPEALRPYMGGMEKISA